MNTNKTTVSRKAYAELEQSILSALERYSNVHRGSGHFSKVSTHLYEKARQIVLESMELPKHGYEVLFMSPRRASAFTGHLPPGCFSTITSKEAGLSLGVVAIAVKRKALPKGTPFETGGGTTKLYGPNWVIWANEPDRFEAGTPAIINVIAFARALQLMKRYGKDIFRESQRMGLTPEEILFKGEPEDLEGKELLEELRKTMIGNAIRVPTTKGLKSFINFDNSASTPSFLPVWEAYRKALRMNGKAREDLANEVRKICAEALGAPPDEYDVLFTSNATESINLAASGLASQEESIEPVILTTVLEHSSNDLPWRNIPGYEVIRLSADNEGIYDLAELEALLRSYNNEGLHGKKRITWITVCGASNVLGTCNDLAAISRMAHQYGARILVDAAQLAAHRKIDMESAGIDCLALSAHKIYAPFGSGLLIARKGFLHFGEVEKTRIVASGEENAGGIAALGKSLLLLQKIGFDLIESEEQNLTKKALRELSQIPGIQLYGMLSAKPDGKPGKTGVIGFSYKSVMSSTVARWLALSGGMGVRFGCLCAHLIIKQLAGFTPFQEKLQRFVVKLAPRLNLQGITRVSFGIQNTEADVDALVKELKQFAERKKKAGSGRSNRELYAEKTLSDTAVKKQLVDFIASAEKQVFG